MSDKIRSHRKKKQVSPIKRVAAIGLFSLVILAAGLLFRAVLSQGTVYISKEVPVQVAMAQIEEPEDADSEISGQYYGLCAKNSTHSVEDFRKTVQSDPVLAAHFSGFDWSVARLGKQEEAIWTFVSYRKGPIIKRTTKPVKLPKGDQYITDGVRIVRTYCCNDYSAAPAPGVLGMVTPVAVPEERVDGPSRRVAKNDSPLPSVTDALPDFLAKEPDYFITPWQYDGPPGLTPYSSGTPVRLQPFVFENTTTSSKEKPPIVTPEPGSFYLMVAGLALFSLFGLLAHKRVVSRDEV
ncbi:MAG: hypothetical protein ACOYL3_11635 [Desulfuromonadaceae bacterium]